LKVSGPAQGNSSRPGAAVAIPQKQKRVLVADDSADNQFLIEAYLKGSAFAVTPVSNGRAAVESFSAHPCDLILMDLRMPEMDGLEATRAIRLLERERGWKAVPVIALTANAQPQDVEKTSQAGCNAHLAKPVSKADLLRTLAEHCGDSIDRPIVVNAPEGLEDLVPRYLSARRQELPELVALSESADFDKLKSIAHNLKGTGTSYGFPDLTEIGAEMETSAGAGDQEKIRQQLVRLSRYLDRVRLRTTA
jgi:CheY-like chemotaxis protein